MPTPTPRLVPVTIATLPSSFPMIPNLSSTPPSALGRGNINLFMIFGKGAFVARIHSGVTCRCASSSSRPATSGGTRCDRSSTGPISSSSACTPAVPTRSGATPRSSAVSPIRPASSPPTTSTRSWRCSADCVVYTSQAETRPDVALAEITAFLARRYQRGRHVAGLARVPAARRRVAPRAARSGVRGGRNDDVRERHRPRVLGRPPSARRAEPDRARRRRSSCRRSATTAPTTTRSSPA